MRLTSRKSDRETSLALEMTPMIDVVFLLLIFFITIIDTSQDEVRETAKTQVNRRSTDSLPDLEPAIVRIVRDDQGRWVYEVGSRRIESEAELVRVLGGFENKVDGAFVQVSDDAPFEMAANAVQACKAARFLSVTYVPMSEE